MNKPSRCLTVINIQQLVIVKATSLVSSIGRARDFWSRGYKFESCTRRTLFLRKESTQSLKQRKDNTLYRGAGRNNTEWTFDPSLLWASNWYLKEGKPRSSLINVTSNIGAPLVFHIQSECFPMVAYQEASRQLFTLRNSDILAVIGINNGQRRASIALKSRILTMSGHYNVKERFR